MSSVSVELEKQKCLRCNKQLRPIKNDFNNRKYHKKCHYEILDNLYLESNYDWNKKNIDLENFINSKNKQYLDNLDKEFNKFMSSI